MTYKISQEEQLAALQYVTDTFDNFAKLNKTRRVELLKIYKSVRSFKSEKTNPWSSSFKINKCHEIENKICAKLFAKNPRWIVSVRTDEFTSDDKFVEGEERKQKLAEYQEMARAIQDYLTYTIDKYNLKEKFRLLGKNMVRYGNAYAKIKYKYETVLKRNENDEIVEDVIGEYPTIDVPSWTDVYVDPRYLFLEDMPGIIDIKENVRFDDLKRKKEKYINLDKIEELPNQEEYAKDEDSSKNKISEITGIPIEDISDGVDKNTLTIKTFYGKYKKEGDEFEKEYEIQTVNDLVVIQCKEKISTPFVGCKCFEDTESYFAIGFLEGIISLQDELNFKKNSASDYINQALNRGWIWSPNSGINPSSLVSKPGGVIATDKTVNEAMNNLQEIPLRPIPSEYFNEQNDMERQIQGLTHTIDTANPRNQQGLTNTATGIKVKYEESNAIINEIRTHFEEALNKIAYKLLECAYENMDSNLTIKKMGDEGYWTINKELFRNVIQRYQIKLEVNSSSFDDLESRREDAIALMNVLFQMKQSGVNVDLTEGARKVLHTFELVNPDDLIQENNAILDMQQELQAGTGEIQQPGQMQPGVI